MPTLGPYPIAKQASPDSGWASAARSVSNWYHSIGCAGPDIPYCETDEAFAAAWARIARNPRLADIGVRQSATAALADLGFDNGADARAFPAPKDIYHSMAICDPLLAVVSGTRPGPNPNPEAAQGDWVVIVGISSSRDDATLGVFDPADGRIHQVPYDAKTYRDGLYWQNTWYVSEYSPYLEVGCNGVSASAAAHASSPAAASPRSPAPLGPWKEMASGGVMLEVACEPQNHGERVRVTIAQTDGPGTSRRYQTTLGYATHAASEGIWRFGTQVAPIELMLTLTRVPATRDGAPDTANLWAHYPQAQRGGVNKIIASWPIGASASD